MAKELKEEVKKVLEPSIQSYATSTKRAVTSLVRSEFTKHTRDKYKLAVPYTNTVPIAFLASRGSSDTDGGTGRRGYGDIQSGT